MGMLLTQGQEERSRLSQMQKEHTLNGSLEAELLKDCTNQERNFSFRLHTMKTKCVALLLLGYMHYLFAFNLTAVLTNNCEFVTSLASLRKQRLFFQFSSICSKGRAFLLSLSFLLFCICFNSVLFPLLLKT